MRNKSRWRKVQNILRFIRYSKPVKKEETFGFKWKKPNRRISKWKSLKNSIKFLSVMNHKKKEMPKTKV